MPDVHENVKQEVQCFEAVLEKLGPFGKFQLIQMTFCFLSVFLMAGVSLLSVFEAYEPLHVCNSVNETKLLSKYGLENDSTGQVFYDSCEVRIISIQNGSEKEIDSIDCPNGRNFFGAKYTTFLSEWDLVCESGGVAEVSHTCLTVGQMIGAAMGPTLGDSFGRKPIFILSSILLTFIESCIVAAPNIFVVYGLKLASGVFLQSLVCCYFVFSLEFMIPNFREANGCLARALWVFTSMIEGAIAYCFRNWSWRILHGATAVMGLISLAYPFVMYESPRWLAANGKINETLRILEVASKINGKDFGKVKETFLAYVNHAFSSPKNDSLLVAQEENENIEYDVIIRGREAIREDKADVFDLLRNKTMLRRSIIMWYLFVTNTFTYYALCMMSSNVTGNRFLDYMLLTLVEFPSMVCVYYLMKKLNRRFVFKIFLGLVIFSFFTSALLFTFAGNLEGTDVVNTALFIMGTFSATSAFTVLFVLAPENFPTNFRLTAIGFCYGLARISSMVTSFINPLYHVTNWAPGLIISAMNMIAIMLTYLLPETKNVNLPDTVDDLDRKSKSRHLAK